MRRLAHSFFTTVTVTIALALLYYVTLYPVGKTIAFFFFAGLSLRSIDLFMRFLRLKKRHTPTTKTALLEGAISGWLASVVYINCIVLMYYA